MFERIQNGLQARTWKADCDKIHKWETGKRERKGIGYCFFSMKPTAIATRSTVIFRTARAASAGRTCTHAGFNGKGKTKTAKTSVSDENTHPHRNHTVVAQTVIGDFSQKRGASRTST
ncbi:hypothetical protein MUO74_03835, partial [Candidatus Bathyarchaeota archaeon]|nr:hypothetical protein [Candidatus Bathyarchaeota archaeon]